MIAGLWLRLLLAAAGAGVLFVTVGTLTTDSRSLAAILAVILVGWAVVRPGSTAVVLVIVGAVLVHLLGRGPALTGELLALVSLLPLFHQAASLAAGLPATSLVSWTALRPSVIRYLSAVGLVGAALLVARMAGV